MENATFNLKKPHVNIGTIGHADCGKTTLTEAINIYLKDNGFYTAEQNTITEYETSKRHYAHFDSASSSKYVKEMVDAALLMDGAILVVSAIDGISSETRENIMISKMSGVSQVIVFISKCDLVQDVAVIDCIESNIRGLLAEYGYDPECPVIRGSALKAIEGNAQERKNIGELINFLDNYIIDPVRDFDKPFIMPVEDTPVLLNGKFDSESNLSRQRFNRERWKKNGSKRNYK